MIERVAGSVRLEIFDDGRGFDPAVLGGRGDGGHVGLTGIVQRVAVCSGRFGICSAPGAGTVLVVWLPVGGRRP